MFILVPACYIYTSSAQNYDVALKKCLHVSIKNTREDTWLIRECLKTVFTDRMLTVSRGS